MQMSVVPHLNLYGSNKKDKQHIKMIKEKLVDPPKMLSGEEQKALIKSKSDANVKVYATKRQEKLGKLSGTVGHNQPYRAPIYLTYKECIRGLYQQGILGFYKGNGMRHFGMFMTSLLSVNISFELNRLTGKNWYTNHLVAVMVADMFTHPIHLLESRFILQNR